MKTGGLWTGYTKMVAFAIAWEGRTGYYQVEKAKKGILGEEISKNTQTWESIRYPWIARIRLCLEHDV